MGKKRLTPLLARIALLIVAVLWGSSLVVVKGATTFIPPNLLLGLRFTIACILLSLIFRRHLCIVDREYLRCGLIIGLCLFLAYSSQTIGVTYAMPGRSAFLSASYCVIVPFLNWAVAHHRPDVFNVMAAVLCVAGVGAVSLGSTASSAFSGGISLGDGLALLSGLFFASHIVAVGKWGTGKDPIAITVLQFGFAAIFSWTVSFCFESSALVTWSRSALLGSIYLAVFCTAIALLLQNLGQKFADPSSAAIILGLESVFGILFSVWFCGEAMTPRLYCGFFLIFLAIVISETKLSFLLRHAVAPQRN